MIKIPFDSFFVYKAKVEIKRRKEKKNEKTRNREKYPDQN